MMTEKEKGRTRKRDKYNERKTDNESERQTSKEKRERKGEMEENVNQKRWLKGVRKGRGKVVGEDMR